MNEELKKKVQFIKEKARRDLENIQRHASEKNFALKHDLALLKEEKQSLKSVKNQLQKENEKLTSEKLKLSRDLRIAEDRRRQIISRYLEKKSEINQYKIFYKDIEVNVKKYQELLAKETSELGLKNLPAKSGTRSPSPELDFLPEIPSSPKKHSLLRDVLDPRKRELDSISIIASSHRSSKSRKRRKLEPKALSIKVDLAMKDIQIRNNSSSIYDLRGYSLVFQIIFLSVNLTKGAAIFPTTESHDVEDSCIPCVTWTE